MRLVLKSIKRLTMLHPSIPDIEMQKYKWSTGGKAGLIATSFISKERKLTKIKT
jgi:hypothetical protein